MPLTPDIDALEPTLLPGSETSAEPPGTSRRRLRHTMGRLIIQIDNSGPGNTPQEGDDYVPDLKRKVQRYAATLTKGNRYAIAPGAGEPGTTFVGSLEEAGAEDAVALWKANNQTEMFAPGDPDLDPEVRRILQRGSDPLEGGSRALLEVETRGPDAAIPKQVRKVLDENQADSPDHPHTDFEGRTENGSTNTGTLWGHGAPLGRNRHNKTFGPLKGGVNPVPSVGIRELKRFGTLLMLKASGELITPTNLNQTDETTWNNQIIASTLLPSLTRLGQSVSSGRFGTAQVLEEINSEFVRRRDPHEGLSGEDPNPSYGSPWNAYVPFSGLAGAPAAISAALLATTVAGLLKGLAELVTFAKGGYSEPDNQFLDLSVPFLETSSTSNRRGRLGTYLEKPQEGFLDRLTGLIDIDTAKTEAPYFKALSKGIDVFFRLDQDTESEGILGAIEGLGLTAANFIEEYGWFSVILRNLFASTTDVFLGSVTAVAQVADPGTNFTEDSALRIQKGTLGTESDLNRITGILSVVNTLNDSYLLRFMNVLASIGDIALTKTFDGDIDDPDDLFDDINPVEDGLTESFPGIGTLHTRGRISNKVPGFGGEIAWAGRTLPSLLLMPQAVVDGAEKFGGRGGSMTGLAVATNSKVKDDNRIGSADVEKIESYLNASYMPFWFHDLRTNEIVSFHAFLTNVTDQFEADYEDTEGYGRPGKSYAWKNTNRQISIEFMTVATSIEDFHQMWWKIDKLVTMVYPQYTRGRVLEAGGQRFVQPFSQLPSSTPLIRLRLGDLFRSNYSKFALARLFGVASGDDGFQADDNAAAGVGAGATSLTQIRQSRDRQRQIRQAMLSGVFASGDTATLAPNVQSVSTSRRGRAPQRSTVRARDGAYIYPRVSDSDIAGSIGESALSAAASQLGAGGAALTSAINSRGGTRTDARLAVSHEGNATIVGPAGGGASPLSIPGLTGGGEGAPAAYTVRISGFQGIYLVPTSALSVHEGAVAVAARDATRALGGGTPGVPTAPTGPSVDPPSVPGGGPESFPGGNAVSRFFSEEENPVIKAFSSTQGSGLPGVIRSIQFNWQDATWETSVLNARAPKICTISLEFAPVHDINPGLDHNGFTTAPVYGVGKFGDLARGKSDAEVSSEQEKFGVLRKVVR